MDLEEWLLELYGSDPFDEEQQARVNWLKNGDQNTSFFHKVAVTRQNCSRLTGLKGEDGRWVSKDEEMLQIALKYFENLFSASKTGDDEMLLGLGFHTDWVVLIMRYVCSVSNTVGINGDTNDWFSPSRGLRQRDPFNPYLFLICAKGFSTLIHEAKQKNLMQGAPIERKRLSINHLFFFVNNCIVFGDASCDGANTVQNIILEYEQVSGQQVDFDKLLIHFGTSVESNVRESVTNIFGVRIATNLKKYSGLPMMVERKKRWAFANFIDRFRRKIDG
ncbi:hypothetical protein PVK06_034241 [Gossypium arboreum]|uniref:Reverse transcriptase n=1 Tax=Gossypium arboreum TaxID=29729 RepID=A0ABR0NE00_GOSAR|nr:hypothetical protein PVK06_034241 [Gossypium arboreum]